MPRTCETCGRPWPERGLTADLFLRLPEEQRSAVLSWLTRHGVPESAAQSVIERADGSYMVRMFDEDHIVARRTADPFPVLFDLQPATEEVTAGAGSEEVR